MWSRANDILVVDRSIHSAYHVYLKLLSKQDVHQQALSKLIYEELDLKYESLLVYLSTTPIVCFQRIVARNRADEARTISLEYITQQMDLFEGMIEQLGNFTEFHIHKYDHTATGALDTLIDVIRKYIKSKSH